MKYVFYVMGILLLTLGISMTIQSELGDVVLVGLSMNVGGRWGNNRN